MYFIAFFSLKLSSGSICTYSLLLFMESPDTAYFLRLIVKIDTDVTQLNIY